MFAYGAVAISGALGFGRGILATALCGLGIAFFFLVPIWSGRTKAERSRDTVSFAVRDTGCGIAPDKLGAIFEPFVHLDRTVKSSHQGTGLGLAISAILPCR